MTSMLIKNRIRELRKKNNLSQEAFASILGTTQQSISRIESGNYDIPTDLLIKMTGFFNVTSDYILGISDIKRDLKGQNRMNHEMDKYYDIVLRYQKLTNVNKKTFNIIMERLEQAQRELDNFQGDNEQQKEVI